RFRHHECVAAQAGDGETRRQRRQAAFRQQVLSSSSSTSQGPASSRAFLCSTATSRRIRPSLLAPKAGARYLREKPNRQQSGAPMETVDRRAILASGALALAGAATTNGPAQAQSGAK